MTRASDPTFTIRVTRDRLERITARAKAAGLSRNEYVLNRADPEGARPRATTPENQAAPTTACPHSRAMTLAASWGTICSVDQGGCGKRIR